MHMGNAALSPVLYAKGKEKMLDVVIVGGSVAGLSAALYLGRSVRHTLVLDEGKPANRVSHASHGFFTRDGMAPDELLKIGREQLQRYSTVRFQPDRATDVLPQADHFLVKRQDGTALATRKVLLAMGVRDQLPPLTNIQQFWGRSVFHCPYCDGWEVRDQPLAIHGNGDSALHRAKLLLNLTENVVICTDGAATFSADDRQFLLAKNVRIIETPLVGVQGQGDQMNALIFADGTQLARRALFIHPVSTQHSDLPARLGCTLNEVGLIQVDATAHTGVPGVYAAGDMTTMARAIVFAAAQGAMAAVNINMELSTEDFHRTDERQPSA